MIKKERTIKSSRNTKVFYLLQGLATCDECRRLFGCRSSNRTKVQAQGKTCMRDRETPSRR